MTDYSKKTTGRTPRPRSKRLRELGSVAPSAGALDSTLLDRLAALESLFEIVDEAVHVKNGRGLYSDSFISAGGIGEPGEGDTAGGSSVQWEQLQKLGKQIANITINGVTTPVYAPEGLPNGLTGLLSIEGGLTEGDVPMWDGTKWVNRQAGAGGGASTSNPYYDDAIVGTMSDGSVVRTAFTNGKVPDWWTNNVLGLSTAAKREKLVKVEIGKNCTAIGHHAFYGCTNLKTIYCYAPVQCDPDSQSGSAFTQMNSYNGVLHYPAGSDYSWWLDAYGVNNHETLGDWNWTGRADAVTPTGEPTGGGSSSGESVQVINNLTSTSTTAALSAYQGRVLKAMINELAIANLVGVTITEPTNGQVLTYKNGKWVNAAPAGGDPSNPGASSIAGLSDVAVTDLAAGDVLYYNGQAWVNFASSNFGSTDGGKKVEKLTDLTDVSASSPSNGDVLYFNGSKWVNFPSSSLGTGTSGGSSGYVLPLANDGTRGGLQLGFISSGADVAVKVADEKAYVTVPDMYIGTTKMQLSSLAQALTGITNLTASGTVRADIGNFTGALTAATIKTTGTLRIGDAILTYADDVLTLRKADGSTCSFIASGNIAAGQ